MDANVHIVERLKKTTRFTRLYCNCESDACASANAHPQCACHKQASVLAEIFGIKQQLCMDCYNHAKRAL